MIPKRKTGLAQRVDHTSWNVKLGGAVRITRPVAMQEKWFVAGIAQATIDCSIACCYSVKGRVTLWIQLNSKWSTDSKASPPSEHPIRSAITHSSFEIPNAAFQKRKHLKI
jgi:hypothetical protein